MGDIIDLDEAIAELSQGRPRFERLLRIVESFFGPPRQRGSHHIFRTPWPGDPRLNLQRDGHEAKPYQVRQVLAALVRLRATRQAP